MYSKYWSFYDRVGPRSCIKGRLLHYDRSHIFRHVSAVYRFASGVSYIFRRPYRSRSNQQPVGRGVMTFRRLKNVCRGPYLYNTEENLLLQPFKIKIHGESSKARPELTHGPKSASGNHTLFGISNIWTTFRDSVGSR